MSLISLSFAQVPPVSKRRADGRGVRAAGRSQRGSHGNDQVESKRQLGLELGVWGSAMWSDELIFVLLRRFMTLFSSSKAVPPEGKKPCAGQSCLVHDPRPLGIIFSQHHQLHVGKNWSLLFDTQCSAQSATQSRTLKA